MRTVPPSIENFTFIGWLLSFPCLCTCKTCVRESLLAANAIYEELYGEPGQGEGQAAVVLPATFQVTHSLFFLIVEIPYINSGVLLDWLET